MQLFKILIGGCAAAAAKEKNSWPGALLPELLLPEVLT